MSDDRDDLLAQIATLYYYHDRSQQEIADQFALSRSNISRMLKEARERGIVEIFIRHPLRRDFGLERQIQQQFGLREVAVVQTLTGDSQGTLRQAAQLAARILDDTLERAGVLGISWGTTIQLIVEAFAPRQRHDIEVVQLMGGVSASDPAIDGTALVQHMARSLGNRYRYLHAPLIVDSAEVASSLRGQRNIAEALELAGRADVALVGIGALDPEVSSLLRAGYLSREELASIRGRGAVGDICARHFDQNGLPAAPEIDARLIAISLDQLVAIPTVIGVAATPAKAPAILGALRGGYLDILVTDSAAAEALILLAARLTPAEHATLNDER
jgi:DNA-binding transcriptional regulator LsrR (DeoR family)